MRGRRGRSRRDSGKQDEGYGLKKNPKKSSRFVAEFNQCEICGRTFGSARAVFGHLRHHSGRRGNRSAECQEDSKRSGESLESKRSRSMTQNSSFNRPSSVADETEKEVDDAAMTLMMISRGVRDWEGRGLNAAAAGSCDNDLGSGNSVSECGLLSQSLEMKKLDCGVSVKLEEHEETGYGAGSHEEEEEGFWSECDKSSRKHKCRICQRTFGSHQALGGHQTFHRMRSKAVEMRNEGKEHECPVCFKVFASGQALGGHSKCHRSLDMGATATGGEKVSLRLSMACRDSGNHCKREVLLTLAANLASEGDSNCMVN